MMNRNLIKNLICLMLVSGFPAVNAEIYKWVDEHGRTHYGEKPPVEDASKIEIRESPVTEDVVEKPGIDRDRLLEVYEEERRQKKEEKRKAEEERKEREKYCKELENDLKDIQRGGLFYELDENGERKYVSEEVVESRKKEMEDNYRKNCK